MTTILIVLALLCPCNGADGSGLDAVSTSPGAFASASAAAPAAQDATGPAPASAVNDAVSDDAVSDDAASDDAAPGAGSPAPGSGPHDAGDTSPAGDDAAATPGHAHEHGAPAGAALPPAVEGGIVPAIERYLTGEHLVYDAYVDKAGISVRVGEAQLRVAREDGNTHLSATAEGSTFGYTLDTTIESVLDRSLRPVEYSYIQRGSEKRQKKLLFGAGGAVYFKQKHCRREDCGNRAHQCQQVNWKMGIIPWGKKRVHCDKRKCRKSSHLVWKERRKHAFDRSYVDMLTAVYEARRLDFDSEDEKTIAVINDHERWLVKILVKSRGKCTVPAGSFDAVEIVIEPVPLEDGDVPENFRGLFGLHGTISVWLDTQTRRPLKIRGIIPFGILDLNASVELAKVEAPGDNEPGGATDSGVPTPAGAKQSE